MNHFWVRQAVQAAYRERPLSAVVGSMGGSDGPERFLREPPLREGADNRTMLAMNKSKKTTQTGFAAKHKASVLGRSALTGTRVLRPATKEGAVSLRQVRSALRALDTSAAK